MNPRPGVDLASQLRAEAAPKLAKLHARLAGNPAAASSYPVRLALEESLRDPAGGIDAAGLAAGLIAAELVADGPFNALSFELYRHTGDPVWRDRFVAAAFKPLATAGPWLHPRGRRGPGNAILIDSFQEEAARVIKVAWLIRRGEPLNCPLPPAELERRAAAPFRLHRDLLRDEQTGLWHNGRGWLPGRLSPGFWSRGHGWLLRGLTGSLRHLPAGDEREALAAILRELAAALLAVRDASGMWRAILVAEPGTASPPESSGSAMITAALLRALRGGLLPDEAYREPLLDSAAVLLRDYLTADGIVLGACPGPGPLTSTTGYLAPATFPPGDPHGVAAICMLAAVLGAGAPSPLDLPDPP